MPKSSSPAVPCILRHAGPPDLVQACPGIRILDARLASVLAETTPLVSLYGDAIHPEGPVWDERHQRLVWSDVAGRRLMAWHLDGHVEVVADATPFVNGNAIDGDGTLLHCEHLRRCISRTDENGALAPLVTHYEGRRLNTPNDITVAADGAIWFTDPIFGLIMPSQGCLAEPELDHRSVYRFDRRSGALQRMADFDQPNGLAFAPDGRTLYVSDTSLAIGGETHDIFAFDVGPGGELSHKRLFWQAEQGVPDGFLTDRNGWIWSSAGDGVHVFTPDGTELGLIPTPCTAFNCAIGGPDGQRLFITAGSNLFAVDLLKAVG